MRYDHEGFAVDFSQLDGRGNSPTGQVPTNYARTESGTGDPPPDATATATIARVEPGVPGDAPSKWGAVDFRRWRIRPKLITVVLIPTLAALLLGGLRMESALAASAGYARLETFARSLSTVDDLAGALQNERDVSVGYLTAAVPDESGRLPGLRKETDTAVNAFRQRVSGVDTSHDPALRNDLAGVLNDLTGLSAARVSADSDSTAALASVSDSYTSTIQSLLNLTGQISSDTGNGDIARRSLALQSLATMKEAASQQRGLVYGAILQNGIDRGSFASLLAASTAQGLSRNQFLANTTTPAQAEFTSTMTGQPVDTASRIALQIISNRSVHGVNISAPDWYAASSGMIAAIGKVQAERAGDLVDGIHSLGQRARNEALASAGLIYVILGFALFATLLVARSILRPLRLLRGSAFDVAYQQLPGTVRRLERGDVSADALQIRPIAVPNRDEIGEVARAFDAVHTEAVHLAGQQAAMRGNVNKMFVNLSRRSQSLVERQLRLIDNLEAGEQDSEQLSNLFQLDHLATRMRRNDENLLVLAGADSGRQRRDPVPMLDVLRAASAEVEQYARVRLAAPPGVELVGTAANDLVHLLAELVENATNFSPPSTLVWVRAHPIGSSGELMIEIEDEGIGMSVEELTAANRDLASPRGMDVSMTQLMGLFVVARLSRRHQVTVQLRPRQTGGTAALVRLPVRLTTSVDVSALTAAPVQTELRTERSPIFDALQSEWFTPRSSAAPAVPIVPVTVAGAVPATAPRPMPYARPPAPAMNGTPAPPVPPVPRTEWRSPGDAGWRAAEQVFSTEIDNAAGSTAESLTLSGLPQRVPGRLLIPGSAADQPTGGPTPGNQPPGPPVPAPVNSRGLSSYQQGIHRARNGAANGSGGNGARANGNGALNGTGGVNGNGARHRHRADSADDGGAEIDD